MAEKNNVQNPLEITSRIILVEHFKEGEETDYIEYVLEEGLRERAISRLRVRDRVTKDAVILDRDAANFLTVEVPDPTDTLEEQEETLDSITSRWSTTTVVNYKLSRKLTESAIDKDIVELL